LYNVSDMLASVYKSQMKGLIYVSRHVILPVACALNYFSSLKIALFTYYSLGDAEVSNISRLQKVFCTLK